MVPQTLSRKLVYPGVEDLIFRYRGETRIGREFSTDCSPETVQRLISLQSRYSSERVVFPDRAQETEDGRVCISAPADDLRPFSGPPRGFTEFFEPLEELHDSGFLHLGISSDSFMLRGDECVLMAWGEQLLSPGGKMPPEIACGGYPCRASDYFLMGSMLKSDNGRLWDGTGAPDLKGMTHWSLKRRLETMGDASSGIVSARLPAPRTFTVIRGGSWQERDVVLNEYVCAAGRSGWQTGMISCRSQESHRPLPGIAPGSKRTETPRDLVERIFRRIDGVPKLLVVDQIDYASEDLRYILEKLATIMTSELSVILTASGDEWPEYAASSIVELAGSGDPASVLNPDEALNMKKPSCFPFHVNRGFRLRTDMVENLEKTGLTPEELFSEGAYRYLTSEEGRSGCLETQNRIQADALIRLGRLDEALDVTDEFDHLRTGIILQMKGDFGSALHHFQKALKSGIDPVSIGLPYVKSLVETGRRSEAEDLLKDSDDVESLEYLSWILDCDGRIHEALEMLDGALSRTVSSGRITLLTSKTVLLMRLGRYDEALITISEAKMLADESMDPDKKEICHVTMGRVMEVMGLWQDALEHYRTATSLAMESYDLDYVSRLVHRYVLEFKMGNIILAGNTLKEMKSIPAADTSRIFRQRTRMIEAFSGVMLCKGREALEAAGSALSMAAELNRTLMKGICTLYKGQLLVQAGEADEGQKLIENAKAVGRALGDRHLVLLSELALCYVQKPVNDPGIIDDARQLKLKFEELEARVIFETGEGRNGAFRELMELPAPLKAFELATNFGLPTDAGLSRRLIRSFGDVCEMLDEDDRRGFQESHPELAVALESFETEGPDAAGNVAFDHIQQISKWIPAYTSGDADLQDLCRDLGLECCSIPPEDDDRTFCLKTAYGETLYVRGENSDFITVLRPLIASVIGICSHSEPESDENHAFPEIIARSESMLRIKQRIGKIAPTRVPVLITGETGTGKDMIARAIFKASGSREPFVTVDCGAIPENLIEAELFGSARGAYTDSRNDRQGLIESANGGTLFLDEIGNMPLQLQSKLLRVLETGTLRRIGETTERKVNFRLISATNADLPKKIEGGEFRSDLYYRIAVMLIEVPPLRERRDDIPFLVRHFTGELCEPGSRPPSFLGSAMARLSSYSWPGNVRELRNVVQRSMLLSSGRVIRESDVCFEKMLGKSMESDDWMHPCTLEDAITRHVYKTYRQLRNKTHAAEVLKCDPKTVSKYVRKYEERFGTS